MQFVRASFKNKLKTYRCVFLQTFYKNFVHRSLKYIREKGIKTPIFLGGPYPTGDYESVLQDENVDICMLGEGELTLTDLVGQMIKNNNFFGSRAICYP